MEAAIIARVNLVQFCLPPKVGMAKRVENGSQVELSVGTLYLLIIAGLKQRSANRHGKVNGPVCQRGRTVTCKGPAPHECHEILHRRSW